MQRIVPIPKPKLLARLPGWFAGNSWTPTWLPSTFRRPFFTCTAAVLSVVVAVVLTAVLEHTLATFSFHGMLGFFAVLCVALVWGSAPALLSAACNALLLNFVVLPPLASGADSPAHVASRGVNLLLSLAFGMAVGVVAGQAEARRRGLAAERNRLRQILEVLPEGVIVYDLDAHVVSMNPTAGSLLGINVLGRKRTDFDMMARRLDGTPVPWNDIPSVRTLATGESFQGVQLLLRNLATGTDFPILTSSVALRDADGTTTGAVTVFQDISAIRDLEQLRDQMLATVAHDLRNPLTSITGMSQILQLRTGQIEQPARERFVHGLKNIETAAQRMAAQISDLLDHAQAQAGHLVDILLEPTDVIALLRHVVDEHQRTTERHTLELLTEEPAIVAMVDPRRLERAVANLLVNAIKYSPQGGPISVSVARAVGLNGQWLSIAVADKGLGIPSSDLPHMFEQYYRASNVSPSIPGTGIGLANVRHIIERHGGVIGIESTEGAGTTVTLRLPLLQIAESQAGAASEG